MSTIMISNVRSPKLHASTAHRWYRYYAGYSAEFVEDVLTGLTLDRATQVLDPWVGSGTTVSVAAHLGFGGVGVDLNPAMIVIAKGRLIASDTTTSIDGIAKDIVRYRRQIRTRVSDPLSQWFAADSVGHIRSLARRIDQILLIPDADPADKIQKMSSLAAFFYVALFEATSSFAKSFHSLNPTWVKKGKIGEGEIRVERDQLAVSFLKSVARLRKYVDSRELEVSSRERCSISLGNSTSLPFQSSSFQAAVSSPPYVTRLDYVVGHLVELAILGVAPDEVKALRHQMIGTPTMNRRDSSASIGVTAESFLSKVANHHSHGSANYYEPNFRQYFKGMAESISEIDRVLVPGSPVVLVVQDSKFKELRIDLAAAVADLGRLRGWKLNEQVDFISSRNMAYVNKRASNYARTSKPIESVLYFSTS